MTLAFLLLQVIFVLKNELATSPIILKSEYVYNNNEWHAVVISRDQLMVKLVVDDRDTQDGTLPGAERIDFNPPFYIGGVEPGLQYTILKENLVSKNVKENRYFNL